MKVSRNNDKNLSVDIRELTAREVAEKFGVKAITVRVWCEKGRFPNAYKKQSAFGVEYWAIPELDLKDFKPQLRRGRPTVTNPSKATLAKRRQREQESKLIHQK